MKILINLLKHFIHGIVIFVIFIKKEKEKLILPRTPIASHLTLQLSNFNLVQSRALECSHAVYNEPCVHR
jgi:hypothetical protein